MASTSTGAARPQSSRKQSQYVVLLRGRVIFTADTLSEAGAYRDGFGAGQVFERVQARKAVRSC